MASTDFPEFPAVEDIAVIADIQQAYEVLKTMYERSHAALSREDNDTIYLNILWDDIFSKALLLLEALEAARVPEEWVLDVTHRFGQLAVELRTAANAADGLFVYLPSSKLFRDGLIGNLPRDEATIIHSDPVRVDHTGRRGRPRKIISPTFLKEATAARRNIPSSTLSKILGVHRNTLRKQITSHGIPNRRKFDNLSDEQLDTLIRAYKAEKPSSGLRYIIGCLRSLGLRIQKHRLILSLRRVDGVGQTLRRHNKLRRRKYRVSRPNAVWHCDGHHKLIWWGIVIHGFIDGFCRTIVGLRASTNNRSSTVLAVFLDAVSKWGTPSRVRGDRGGENVAVSVWMIMNRGPNRASFMWGSSTRNTRIERLWVEVGKQFARRWRAFFTRLSELHNLNRHEPAHVWLLHVLFLDEINNDCKAFVDEWNAHPIRGRDTHDQSPADMRLLGQLQHGEYINDPFVGVHPDLLTRYHSVSEEQVNRSRRRTGAGHPDDESSDSESDTSEGWEDESVDEVERIENRIADDIQHNIRHKPIKTAKHQNPFEERPELEEEFCALLADADRREDIPHNYGLLPDEWEHGYPVEEEIKVGTRGKSLTVTLPPEVWFPRAVRWGRALDIMSRLLANNDDFSDDNVSI